MSVFDDEVLTIEELASFLKLKRQTIYRWAQVGKLPGAKIGKEWRFRRSVIEKWFEDNFGKSQTPAHDGDGVTGRSPRPRAPASRRKTGPSTS
ncbi:MAG TPA: helix-turn-helix domain-containing protein [Planctomycetota bacterium]|jgi:excisionase family DNA binding protein|nr:helix-turn-helix domain-containing protein [Planctomycetota bacterium]